MGDNPESETSSSTGDVQVVDAQQMQQEKDERDKKIAKEVMLRASALVRASNALPRSGDDFELCNSFSTFNQFMRQQENRIGSLLTRAMTVAGCPVRPPKPPSDTDAYMDKIIRANDGLAERSGVLMDELEKAGRDEEVQVPKVIVGAESTKKNATPGTVGTFSSNVGTCLAARLKAAHEEQMASRNPFTGPKPQKKWGLDKEIDNSRDAFKPKLLVKHNARENRKTGLTVTDTDGERSRWVSEESVEGHPYRVELDHFTPADAQLESAAPKKYGDISSTPLTTVDTVEALQEMCDALKKVKEFAVDLEHHDHRSFLGFICLMQISTRDADYIVDPFPIWKDIHILNEIFTDPNILKVFHGADRDIVWLQRDWGVYVVNMFDTYHAMRQLELQKFSLQFLVHKYCDVLLDKQYQVSDWRIRPLSAEQLAYARCDTHYLLYCHDELREALLEKGNEQKNLLTAVYNESRLVCAKPYEKPQFDPLGYEKMLGSRRTFNSRQMYALAELWRWRDEVARKEDESLSFVLPNHMMMHIAEALPREMQGIIACCSPVPVMVKEHLLDLHRIVYAARDQPLSTSCYAQNKAGGERNILENLIDEQNRMTRVKALLRCKLDFSHSRFDEEIGGGLVQSKEGKDSESIREKSADDTFLGVFSDKNDTTSRSTVVVSQQVTDRKKVDTILSRLEKWATPFECYTIAVKEAADKEEKRQAEEKLRKETVGDGPKTQFSHHDPTVCRKPVFQDDKTTADGITLSTAVTAPRFTDDQILTKKALKRQHKKTREAADIRTDLNAPPVDKPNYTVKRVKKDTVEGENGTEATGSEVVEPVDYSQYDIDMFNQKKRGGDDGFDPFHQKFRVENKKNQRKRGRGGFHRMGTMTTGYKPQEGGKGGN